MNRALFLDRDGVINQDYGYVYKIEDFHFRDGIFEVCKAAQAAMMKIIVVTNQAGIGRGYYTTEQFNAVSAYMRASFRSNKIEISGIYYCPFHPYHGLGHFKHDSLDRKPKSGMFIKACKEHLINPFHSIMIGDKSSDQIASAAAGIRNYISSCDADWIDRSINAIRTS